jgi:NADH-quinone oxidoreductase subunit N
VLGVVALYLTADLVELFAPVFDTLSYVNGFIFLTNYSLFLQIIISLIGIVSLLTSRFMLAITLSPQLEYAFLIILAILALFVLTVSNHLVLSLICISVFSLSLYALIFTRAHVFKTREAGIKYFYLSAISSSFLLCGVFLMLACFKTAKLDEIAEQIFFAGNSMISASIFYPGLVAFFLGLFFKLSAFPGHL